jgi:acyl-CoA reductase-like NAD-dependent aldehyde dehydrogenase
MSTVALVGARQPFVDGKFVPGEGPVVAVENPATETTIAEVESGSPAQMERAILAARRSFDDGVWAGLPREERAARIRIFVAELQRRRDELVHTVVAEAGCPLGIAQLIQVDAPLTHMLAVCDLYLGLPEEEYNPVPSDGLVTMSGNVGASITRYEPVGVVGAISPYNFPLYVNLWKVIPPMLTGCSVVLRPSPLTPLSALVLGDAADAANLPPGVLNIVVDAGIEGGRLLSSHPAVDMVTFTGSTAVGKQVMAQASDTVKRVHLELGGKSAQIYLPDAVDRAAMGGWSVFISHQGQGCALATRMLVPNDKKDEVLNGIAEMAATITIGDPADARNLMGPVITAAQRDKCERYVQLAVDAGARVVCGGGRPNGLDKGYFFEPTVIDAPDNNNPAARDEIFGPVLTVLGYDDLDDAVAIANDSEYGLAGMIHAKDVTTATKVAHRMRTGTVWINAATPSAYAPFGGYKQSGIGREMGTHGLREYQEIKHLMIGS